MQQLTYHSETFFSRIDELLQDDKIERAEFYLTMLLNTAVSRVKQHFDW